MPSGFLRTKDGVRAHVRVASKADNFNVLRTKRFPATATDEAIQEWRKDEEARLRLELEQHRKKKRSGGGGGSTSGFRYDAIERYLPLVRTLPTYDWRVKDIQLWVDEFGERPRDTITSLEIRAVRERWLTVGPKWKQQKINGKTQWVQVPEPLAASTVNHRLRALSNLWTVLDPDKPNPAKKKNVKEAAEPQAVPRAIDYQVIRGILDAMADRGRPVKGEKRATRSVSKVRARVMAWTGIEATELGRIPEHDIIEAIKAEALIVPPRRKGSGVPGRIVPLNQDGVEALTDLVRLKACGPFNGSSVLHAWQRACVKKTGRTFRLKDLRHSYVTGIARSTGDLRLAKLLAGHSDDRTTQRYALAAMLPLLRAGVDAFDKETKA